MPFASGRLPDGAELVLLRIAVLRQRLSKRSPKQSGAQRAPPKKEASLSIS